MREGPVRVAIMLEEIILLKALTALLDEQCQFTIVGAAQTAAEFAPLVIDTQPDVAVLDLDVTQGGVFDIARQMRQRSKETQLMFVSRVVSECLIEHSLMVGARGYLTKRETPDVILDSILRVAIGEYCFSNEVRERVEYSMEKDIYVLCKKNSLAQLTSRQLEVLRHLARGESVKEVAKAMHLSQKSVDSHKYRIMNKLGIHDRVLLTRLAIREGLMLP